MTEQQYTPIVPTTEIVENQFVYYEAAFMNISNEASRARFQVWLAERDARIEAAAEQRGAAKALRDTATQMESTADFLGESYMLPGDIIAWLSHRADQIEVDDE